MHQQFQRDSGTSLEEQCSAVWSVQDPDAAGLVDELWRSIDARLLTPADGAPAASPASSAEGRCRTWATASVFISSTFKDFFAERECLVKRVFPALRDWCESRRIILRDCDLRWGVPSDCTGAEAVSECLDLIDRCRDETGGRGAFFLGLVGDRFGWVPGEAELTPDLAEKFGWLAGCSATQMEMLRGGFVRGRASPNALFMLRDPTSCWAGLPDRLLSDFAEPGGSVAAAQAARQRLELVRRFPAEQVRGYSAEFEGTCDEPGGKERTRLSGLGAFEECVLTFFKRAIALQFPGHVAAAVVPSETEVGESNESHINYMHSLVGAATVGQERCLRLLTSFAETGEVSMSDCRLFGDSGDHIAFGLPGVKTLVVAGDAGIGKSTMLARLGLRFLYRRGFEVLAHFAQFSPASNDRRTLQRKMKAFVKGLLPQAEAAKVGDDSSVSDLFNCIMKIRRTMLILIDAFECFYEVSHVGELLPVAWPQNVRCVVSCRRKDLDRCFSERSVCLYELEGLEPEAQAAACRSYLGSYGRRLDPGQLDGLLAKAGAGNPLWLSQACAELRVHGDHASLTRRIVELPADARTLLKGAAARLVAEDAEGATAALLALVCVSRVGLWERHARRLVRFAADRRRCSSSGGSGSGDCGNGDCGGRHRAGSAPTLPLAEYLRLLRGTRSFLRTIARESPALAFRHELSRCAVQELLLDSPEMAKRWHSLAADFILTGCGAADACLERDLPYHLYWSDRRCELHSLLQGAAPNGHRRRQFSLRLSHLTASGVYGSWRCRVQKVADRSPLTCLVACRVCALQPSRLGAQRTRCCIYCGLTLNSSRPGSAVPATTCQQHMAPGAGLQRCWFCSRVCDTDVTALQVCNFCNSSASSYLCYQPVLETDQQFGLVVRNQTKKFGLQW